MLRLISRAVLPWLLVASCTSDIGHSPTTIEGHEALARHYEATAAGIARICRRDLGHELTADPWQVCWKTQDKRFLEANLNAAAEERATAERMRAQARAQTAQR